MGWYCDMEISVFGDTADVLAVSPEFLDLIVKEPDWPDVVTSVTLDVWKMGPYAGDGRRLAILGLKLNNYKNYLDGWLQDLSARHPRVLLSCRYLHEYSTDGYYALYGGRIVGRVAEAPHYQRQVVEVEAQIVRETFKTPQAVPTVEA
jgi:hypothetical protein